MTCPMRVASWVRKSVRTLTLSEIREAAAEKSPCAGETSQKHARTSRETPWKNAHGPLSKIINRTLSLSVPCIHQTVTVKIGFIINVSSHLENAMISLIRIKKPPFSQLRKIKARLTLRQQATENSKEGKTKQRTKDQETETKKEQKIK